MLAVALLCTPPSPVLQPPRTGFVSISWRPCYKEEQTRLDTTPVFFETRSWYLATEHPNYVVTGPYVSICAMRPRMHQPDDLGGRTQHPHLPISPFDLECVSLSNFRGSLGQCCILASRDNTAPSRRDVKITSGHGSKYSCLISSTSGQNNDLTRTTAPGLRRMIPWSM